MGNKLWYALPAMTGAALLFTADKQDPAFAKLVNKEFSMVDAITNMRGAKASELMAKAEQPDDPMQEVQVEANQPNKARKDMIDDTPLATLVTMTIQPRDYETVKVDTSANPRSKLRIIMTPDAANLLCKEPPHVFDDGTAPIVTHPHVKRHGPRQASRVSWFDKASLGWKTKSIRIPRGPGMQEAVDTAAAELEQWHLENHRDRCQCAREKQAENEAARQSSSRK